MSNNELFAFALCSFGALIGAVGNKLVAVNYKTNWKWAFYLLGVASIIFGVIKIFSLNSDSSFLDYFTFILLLVSGSLLIVFTKYYLDKKNVFETSELNPIINKFTDDSDKSEIKLFGGDFNFLGNTPQEMDQNIQYSFLKSYSFRKVLILCEEPRNTVTKIRYGKILSDMNGVELRFYNPEEADLQIRGRMKKVQGVDKLLLYSKVVSGKYKTIETDTANSDGALYRNLWYLIWSLAKELNQDEVDSLIKLYK